VSNFKKIPIICDGVRFAPGFFKGLLSVLWASVVTPNEAHHFESCSCFSLTGSGKKEIVFGGPVAIFAHPFLKGALAQLVRALPCHGRGCGFEPRRLRFSFEWRIYSENRMNKGSAGRS
jgi:hypothetical protein